MARDETARHRRSIRFERAADAGAARATASRPLATFAVAWLGWGFDIFDSLLFNYVAPACIPSLSGLPIGSAAGQRATLLWSGLLTSTLLVGWAIGGFVFGHVADRIGRVRTLRWTIAIYAIGAGSCSLAQSIPMLVVCRALASLGIGGEWASGAALVAEVTPERRRVEAGALLFTAAPFGLFLATLVNHWVSGIWLADDPRLAWRVVLLVGSAPALLAIFARRFVPESAVWQRERASSAAPRAAELFGPRIRRATWSGFAVATVAAIVWWSCNAFIPVIAAEMARVQAVANGLDIEGARQLAELWQRRATLLFNCGGLLGVSLTVPLAKLVGRRPMFRCFFAASSVALCVAFGFHWAPETRLLFYFPVGVSVFGVAGSFTFYLPELFPVRLRATGAGFCFNVGRLFAAAGPLLVGYVSSRGSDALASAFAAQLWLAAVPLAGLSVMHTIVETRTAPVATPFVTPEEDVPSA